MQWADEALILDIAKYGEQAALVQVFAREHGRYAGLSRAALSSKNRACYQPGNLVHAQWSARLPEHLGTIRCEAIQSFAAYVMDDALRLAGVASLCALLKTCLAEHDPHPKLYDAARMLALHIAHDEALAWLSAYVRFEVLLLAECGIGLSLSECAATGAREDLVYVSPKTGRAVSRAAGEPYRDKLLELPAFLQGQRAAESGEAVQRALMLTGYFLHHHWQGAHHQPVPPARARFIARLEKAG